VLLFALGCGGPKAYIRPELVEHPPQRVAVLPFIITYAYDIGEAGDIPPSHQVGRDIFRKTFYYAFTPYGYEDMKLAEVDERLTAAWGPIEGGAWQHATPQMLGKTLEADAVVYGEIKRLMHFSTPLYTETSLTATLRMVNARSGEELWRQKVKVAERGGALFKKGQVVDFLKDQARSFNPAVKFLRVSDVAVRRALKDMPNPPMSSDVAAASPWRGASDGQPSVRLVLLPLETKRKGWDKAAETLRQYLAASLQESPFDVVELQRTDAALKTFGWTQGAPLPSDLPLAEVAHALDADVVLHGTVTNWGRTYAVVESWVKAEVQVELIDAQSGEVIWSDKKKNSRTAGLLKGPTGYKSLATSALSGLKSSHLERVANHLTREVVEGLNGSPAVMAYVSEQKP
jgi:hypothetical protein